MSRAVIVVHSRADRERIAKAALTCPPGTRVEFKAAKRSLPQNDRFWAMLTDIAQQVSWHGLRLTTTDWKFLFLDALKREMRLVPNIDGTGFVSLGRSSSDLSKEEMGDVMTLMEKFGAERGVRFHDDDDARAA